MSAAMVCAPYTPHAFDSLPMLSGALRCYGAKVQPQEEAVFGALGKLFERHAVLDRFGLALVHRHFEMAHHERLVESRDAESGAEGVFVSRPLPAESETAQQAVPHAWKIESDGSLTPYEFTTEGCDVDVTTPEVAAFVKELAELLSAAGLDGVFGLNALRACDAEDPRPTFERTVGRANIERPLTEEVVRSLQPHESMADAMWRFRQAGKGKPITRACQRICSIHRWTYDHECVGHNSV